MFKVGQKIIFQQNHPDTLVPQVVAGTVTKVGKDTVWLDNAYKAEDQVYAAFIYPDTPECRQFIADGIALNLRHKQEQDERMKLTYQFNNELVRQGLK